MLLGGMEWMRRPAVVDLHRPGFTSEDIDAAT